MNRRLTIFLSVVLGILLVGIWLYIVDFEEMLNVFPRVNLLVIFPLGLLFLLTYFLRSLRWKIILSPVEKITAFESFNLCMVNYFINFLIPVHAGEVVKSMLLKKIKGTPVSKSIMTVYIDKISDLLPIFLLLTLSPFIQKELKPVIYLASGIILLILLMSVFTLIFIAHKKKSSMTWIDRIFFFLSEKIKLKLSNFINLFVEGLSSMSLLKGRLFEIIGLTILALVSHCFLMWLFFFTFGINLPVLAVLVGYLLLNVSFVLPAPPGFSGSLELTFVFIFTYLYGYDINLVSSVAAFSHIFIAALFGLLGFLSLTLIGTKLSTVLRAEA